MGALACVGYPADVLLDILLQDKMTAMCFKHWRKFLKNSHGLYRSKTLMKDTV